MNHETSDKRRAANQANAKHSTGPKTPEGKARSAQNARQHGFTASTFAVVRIEDLDEIAKLKADLITSYKPQNSQELFAIERIALAQQSLLRVARLEAGLFTTAFNTAVDRPGPLRQAEVIGGIEITRAQNQSYLVAEGFHQMTKTSNSWALFLRYQAQAERQYRRALEEFDRLKPLREEIPNEPIEAPQPEETKPPDPDEMQVLTQTYRDENGRIECITEKLVPSSTIRDLPKGNY